jgi:hypothetical protein
MLFRSSEAEVAAAWPKVLASLERTLPREHPWQLWLFNAGRLALGLGLTDVAQLAWWKAYDHCLAGDETIQAMALLPLSALGAHRLDQVRVEAAAGPILAPIKDSVFLCRRHFAPLLASSGPLAALELVWSDLPRFFPLHLSLRMTGVAVSGEDFDPRGLFGQLPLAVYRLRFHSLSSYRPPELSGSTWRGCFGLALRRLACQEREQGCPACPGRSICLYAMVFEPNEGGQAFQSLPRPYVLRPLRPLDGRLGLELVLLGPAAARWLEVLSAWEEAGQRGFGPRRARHRLELVHGLSMAPRPRGDPQGWVEIRNEEGAYTGAVSSLNLAAFLDAQGLTPLPPWRVEVLTPLRVRRENGLLDRLDWPHVWTRFGLRLAVLAAEADPASRLDFPAWRELKAFLAGPGEFEAQSRWRDQRRYSARQGRYVPLGGLLGWSVIVPPQGAEATWWRWWKAAELLHLGKGTTMGLGQVKIGPVD